MQIPPHLVAEIDQRYGPARRDVLNLIDTARSASDAHGAAVGSALLAAELFDRTGGDAQQLAGMLGLALVELASHGKED